MTPDVDVLFVSEVDTHGTYVFDVRSHNGHHGLRKAITFAQQQLLREVEKRGFDILLIEGYVVCRSAINSDGAK
jgi:hypothetical protein